MNDSKRFLEIVGVALFAAVAGCDYSGDFLFADASGVEDIRIFTGPDGDLLVPADITDLDSLRANTMYAELGPPLTSDYGGATIDFVGTGGAVCLWVDPETAYWTQAIAERLDDASQKWSYPDNVFDDGDIDLLAGLSVYYTGSPGEQIGDFVVSYEDSLGNAIPISLAACPNQAAIFDGEQFAGRGSPEYCTIPATDLGIAYTILLRTWSTPLDDDRLSFGFILASGSCESLREVPGLASTLRDECLIQGESLAPGENTGPFYGFDEVNEAGRIWEGSIDFEAAFCDPEIRMQRFCRDERDAKLESDTICSWTEPPTGEDRCYCGNEDDTPKGGAF